MVRLTGLSLYAAIFALSIRAALIDDPSVTRDLVSRAVPKKQGCMYNLNGVGLFKQHLKIDFTKQSQLPPTLYSSDYEITASPDDPEHPSDQYYNSSHVAVKKGKPLRLTVPGGQTQGPVQGAEITTVVDDILYASVRTVAKMSDVGGTCHGEGFFFYKSDTQETDIEIRTSFPDSLFLTNQKVSRRSPATTYEAEAPCDMASDFHEYRLDWLKGVTRFYVDGELVTSFKKNVPTKAGSLVWNNWANGGSWSGGPPLKDSVLEIKTIEVYYNRTSTAGKC